MTEEEDKLFREACWDDYLAELGEMELKLFRELISLGVDVNSLRTVYDRVSMFSDVAVHCREQKRPNFDRIRDTLFPLLDAAAPFIPTTEPEQGWDTVQRLVTQTRQKMQMMDLTDDTRILEIAKDFDCKLAVTLKRWTSKEQASEMKKIFRLAMHGVISVFTGVARIFVSETDCVRSARYNLLSRTTLGLRTVKFSRLAYPGSQAAALSWRSPELFCPKIHKASR